MEGDGQGFPRMHVIRVATQLAHGGGFHRTNFAHGLSLLRVYFADGDVQMKVASTTDGSLLDRFMGSSASAADLLSPGDYQD